MSRSLGNVIADSLALNLSYAERLLKDVSPERFGRFAAPGGVVVNSNHGAFIYGHLSLYGPRILKELGHDAPAIPDNYTQKFSKDAECVDDVAGQIYPSMDEITGFFFDHHQKALEALKAAEDDFFQQTNPGGGRMTELFPTTGSMHSFLTGGHIMIHLGQMSAWRRMEGLGAA